MMICNNSLQNEISSLRLVFSHTHHHDFCGFLCASILQWLDSCVVVYVGAVCLRLRIKDIISQEFLELAGTVRIAEGLTR
jgi:hypothetical protein